MANDELSTRVTAQIQKLLQSVAEEQGFCDFKVEKTSGGTKGDGYLGYITSISIIGKTKSNQKKVLHVIVKSASRSDALRKEAPIASVFDREIYMYNCVFPAFRNFSIEKGLPPFSNFAKCYKACMIDKSEALILENLKEAGFKLWDRRIPMDHDHVSFVMAEYGRLHALSFALRDQHPERFHKITDSMDDIFVKFMNSGDFTKMFKNQCVKAYDSLDPVADKQALKTFKAYIDEKYENYFKSLDKLVDDNSVILHGDCWTNNMLFKYENTKEPGKPTKICLIDLQISRVGPTVLDLSYFFFACANKKALDNYEHYLEIYYHTLSDYMKKLGSDPQKLYPYSLFRQEWKAHAKFGMVTSMLLIHAMLSETAEAVDFTEIVDSGKSVTDAFDYDLSNIGEYNDRVKHIILHFVNNKLI